MSRSDVLVDADWAEAHIGDPGVVIVEVDEDTSAYDKGHIPTAQMLTKRRAVDFCHVATAICPRAALS